MEANTEFSEDGYTASAQPFRQIAATSPTRLGTKGEQSWGSERILILLFGGGGGYYGYNRWGYNGGFGIGLGTILVILLILFLLGVL